MLLLGLGTLPSAAQAQFCPGPGFVFIDVPDSDPMCPAITWVADRGVTLGCAVVNGAQRLFCPTQDVARNQMAAFMQRLGDSLFPINCPTNSVMQWNGTAPSSGPQGRPDRPARPVRPAQRVPPVPQVLRAPPAQRVRPVRPARRARPVRKACRVSPGPRVRRVRKVPPVPPGRTARQF
jgi:hypothetical protein